MIKVNDDPMEWRDGMTVQSILDIKKYKFPMLIVTLDELHISKEQYTTTRVLDGANIKIIHMLSGG